MNRGREHGHSFSELIDDLKKDLALRYIKSKDLNLTHASFLLGYANHGAFSTAFKRLTGKTPRQARSSMGDLA